MKTVRLIDKLIDFNTIEFHGGVIFRKPCNKWPPVTDFPPRNSHGNGERMWAPIQYDSYDKRSCIFMTQQWSSIWPGAHGLYISFLFPFFLSLSLVRTRFSFMDRPLYSDLLPLASPCQLIGNHPSIHDNFIPREWNRGVG